jgi:putative transposase
MRTLCCPSDLTDAQWAPVAPQIPAAKSGDRPRTTDVRAVFVAIIYLLRTGCQWRQLPSDFPPWPTGHGYFRGRRMTGVWVLLHRALYPLVRLAAGQKPEPTLVIMDGQSVKTTERGGVRGFDWHKRRAAGRAGGCWPGLCRSGRPFVSSLLMRDTKVASLLGSCCATGGTCRSSNANSERSRLPVSPGLLSAASHGSASTAASRRITNALSRHQKHCWTSLQFAGR